MGQRTKTGMSGPLVVFSSESKPVCVPHGTSSVETD